MRRLRSTDPAVDLPIHRWSHEHDLVEEVGGDWIRELLKRREERDHSGERDLPAELRAQLRAKRGS
jgi:hypothetical protein